MQMVVTIDVLCNLSNLSHFDIYNARPGFAVWTETVPGAAKNWYVVLPNFYGVDTCHGYWRRQFAGVAIELMHGVGISWDGRRVGHCTSPVFKRGHPNNHVYATFCAAKVRVLNFAHNGRASGQERSLAVQMKQVQAQKQKEKKVVIPMIRWKTFVSHKR